MLYVRGINLFLLAMLFSFVSCGKNGGHQFVKSAKLKPYTIDAEVFVELSTELDFGNMVVPSASYTVKNPNGNGSIGSIDLVNIAGGKVNLVVSGNLSVATGIRSSYPRMPNGALVPLIGTNEAMEIPVFKTSARFYAAIFDGAAAMGVAIPVKAFDAIGKNVGKTSLFPMFNIGSVVGAAGLFTSSKSGQNGFGVFADISGALSKKRSISKRAAELLSLRSVHEGSISYKEYKPSRGKKKKIDKMLWRLSRKRARVIAQ